MRDYGNSGLSIQDAFVEEARSSPQIRGIPPEILWNGRRIKTAARLSVPTSGRVRGEFLSLKPGHEQAFDLKLKGTLHLGDGSRVSHLRTWHDPNLEPEVEYQFESEDGFLWVSNVSRYRRPNGEVVEERWTGNSGLWVERLEDTRYRFHCSASDSVPPDFETFLFELKVSL